MRARKIVRGLKEGLIEDERHAVADSRRAATQGARRSLAPKRRGEAPADDATLIDRIDP